MSTVSSTVRTEWSRRLGEALAAAGCLQPADADRLVEEAVATGTPLAVTAIRDGFAAPEVVVTTLARLAGLPAVDLRTDRPSPAVDGIIPADLAADLQAVGLRSAGSQLVVVFAEPPDEETVQAISEAVGYQVVPALGDPLVVEALLSPGPTMAEAGAASAAAGPADLGPPSDGRAGQSAAPPPPPVPMADGNATELDERRGPFPGRRTTDATAGGSMVGERPLHVDDLLRYAVGVGASDLHLTVSMPPTLRLHGALRPLEDVEKLDNDMLREMIYSILTQSQREQFEEEHELDTSHSIPGVGRFRVNVCLQRGTVAVALRPIPHEIPEFSTLGVPESVATFASLRRGLVLVTGPTGSGKSTTLASLIDIVNREHPLHVVTVEDPIEFLHSHKRSVITQREVGSDTLSFAEALRRALRQDPDVILVGELRDLETIATALTASETGHLVFATLHTQDAPSTIDRIIDVFPPNQQDQIRIQLGSSLAGVVTQQLVPTVDGRGRAVATEVLICTPAIQNLIRGAKTHQIYSLMQTGAQHGMQTMDQSLALLVKQKLVTEAVALDRCRNEEDFRNHLVGR